jgi:hypothetical protein
MEKIEIKQENLAGKDIMIKKEWKKPEIKELKVKMTALSAGYLGSDGVFPSAATS